MGNLHLVTGYAGEAHVTAADRASFNMAFFGNRQGVLDIGNGFAAAIVSNNQITVSDGDAYMQGRHIRLNSGSTVPLAIDNGSQGYFRNDLIVMRYTKNANTGVEQADLVVIKGTAAGSNPSDPAYISGNLKDGDLQADMPLYRVVLDGLTVTSVVQLFDVITLNSIVGEAFEIKGKCATTATYTANVSTTWATNSDGGWKQTISVPGMLATDNPIVDLVLGDNVADNTEKGKSWRFVTRITTADNAITLYANLIKPSVAFTIQLKVVR